jgi:hypothetical protein
MKKEQKKNKKSTHLVRSDESSNCGLRFDMAQIGGDSGSMDNIVEVQLGDAGIQLQQHGQRLANAYIY